MKKFFVSILILGVVGAAIFFLLADTRQLIVEPSELEINKGSSAQLNAYLVDADSGEKENVTDRVEWSSSDPSIVTVGNKSVKGQVLAKLDTEGLTEIVATLNDQTINVPVQVVTAELTVECYPVLDIGRENTSSENAEPKVGDVVMWFASYGEIGTPNYTYEWTGTDGLSSDLAIAEMVYSTPGLKKAKIFTVDMAGSSAEGECEITIVE